MTAMEDVRGAAELVGFGLRTGARPSPANPYGQLLERYRADTDFRDLVDTVASGLDLVVLGAPRTGLVLTTQPGSAFAVRLTDLRSGGLSADEKMIAGLILLAIAAYAFPRESDLDAADVKVVSVGALDTFIRAAITRLGALHAEDRSTDAQVVTAASIYAKMGGFVPKQSETGSKKGSSYYAITEVFGWLVDRGAARVAPTMGAFTYQLTDRFRLLVADVAGGQALTVLQGLRRAETETS